MKWDDIQELPCSIARTLSVIGDRWTMMIVRESFLGTRRFEQFQRRLGVTRHRLSERLNKLVENEILRKHPYQDSPPRYEYRLTRKGVALYPILMAMAQWGDEWMDEGLGQPVLYQHKTCGKFMHIEPHCSECGEVIDPREVVPTIGPGLKNWQEKQAARVKS